MSNTIYGVAGATIALCANLAIGATTYTVTEIGTFGGPESTATALNNAGIVVGFTSTAAAPNISHAFRWTNGVLLDLGTLGGPGAQAFDINDAGQITGLAETEDSIEFNEIYHAFRWENGSMLDIGTTGGDSSRGWAINSQGQIAGASMICWVDPKNPKGPCFPVGNEYAFYWDGNTATDLGGLFGSSDSSVLGMNDSSELVGQSITVNGFSQPRHACVWVDGQVTDLGTLGGFNSWAFDINNNGRIVGFSDDKTNSAHHVFIYQVGVGPMIDLGVPPETLSAEALAINNLGQIVGVAFNCCEALAFVYDGSEFHDLNTLIPPGSGWTLIEGTDINDGGSIVGYGMHNGVRRGFLLKPVECVRSADLNCDGTVNVFDLFQLLGAWGNCGEPCPPACAADIADSGGAGSDCAVNIFDLFMLLNDWG